MDDFHLKECHSIQFSSIACPVRKVSASFDCGFWFSGWLMILGHEDNNGPVLMARGRNLDGSSFE